MMKKVLFAGFLLATILACKNQIPTQQASRTVNPTNNKTIEKEYQFQTFENDPLKARVYTLENGLKVYLTVYKDKPRIQTSIAVATGSKNDPSNATGLAHYLEHMLFKGTESFGTKDYSKEKPYLDEIRDLYEEHRAETNSEKRKEIYHRIDSVSNLASEWSIANEYDKMLSNLGANGTNAYTSNDETVYINNIPSNQIENWLKIEADRFMNPVLRIFHTELEAVYEEKNRSLDSDGSRVWETLLTEVFKGHTYGSQSTIGTIEHLKNPSILEIEKYLHKYYVPNNIAICMSGDFDPDEVIKLIDSEFGNWKPKEVAPHIQKVEKLDKIVHKEIVGPEQEEVTIAFQFKGANDAQMDTVSMVDMVLMNGMAGLLDLNLNQAQRVLYSSTYVYGLKEASAHMLNGSPKEGQTLEDVTRLMLDQLDSLKKGNFDESLLSSIINDYKLSTMKQLESNNSRTDRMVTSFINEVELDKIASRTERMSKISKAELIDFVKRHYNENYVEVFKIKGERQANKVEKPEITPVKVNRDEQSDFVKEILSSEVDEIEPVFLDIEKDLERIEFKNGLPIYYVNNLENESFFMTFRWELGSNHSQLMDLAGDYFSYLGTELNSNEDLQKKFFEIGASYRISVGEKTTMIYLSGLTENMERALVLLEDIMNNARPNQEILDNLVQDVLKGRENALSDRNAILRGALYSYVKHGDESSYLNVLSKEELLSLKAEDVVKSLKDLLSYQHEVFFYGNKTKEEVKSLMSLHHKVNRGLINPSTVADKKLVDIDANTIYFVNYEMEQTEFMLLSKGDLYDSTRTPMVTLYNNYFGGGMGGIVFQEIRESKALAYSAYSKLNNPYKAEYPYYNFTYIGCQADKLKEAIDGIQLILNDLPQADKNLEIAKEAIEQKLRTGRVNKEDIYFTFKAMERLGLLIDPKKMVFEQVPNYTMQDLVDFHKKYIANQTYVMIMIGNQEKVDLEMLKNYGEVKVLELSDIFAY